MKTKDMETFGWKNVFAPAIAVEYIRVTATRLVTCVAGASPYMWKSNKEEVPAKPSAPNPTYTGIPAKEVRPVDVTKPFEARSDMAHIGKSVLIKGELSGSEDLYLDGEVEGTIELQKSALTVGPNGKIRAHVNAREVIVHGKVDGNLNATDKVELKRTAILVGDIKTQRITIEDGAYFKGSIDIQREAKAEPRKETPAVTSAVAAPAAAGVTPQGSFADKK